MFVVTLCRLTVLISCFFLLGPFAAFLFPFAACLFMLTFIGLFSFDTGFLSHNCWVSFGLGFTYVCFSLWLKAAAPVCISAQLLSWWSSPLPSTQNLTCLHTNDSYVRMLLLDCSCVFRTIIQQGNNAMWTSRSGDRRQGGLAGRNPLILDSGAPPSSLC